MKAFLLVPVALGFLAVLQGVLNRRIAAEIGLASATVINNVVILAAGIALYFFVRWSPHSLPSIFSASNAGWRIPWWIILPGLCGLALVAGIPLSISKMGASSTFILLIGAQIIASLLWDIFIEKRALTLTQSLGAMLVFGGAALTTLKST